jgi:hypothetical protein
MENLLASMQEQAKRINAYIYNPELSESKWFSYFVKEDQKVGFNDFVKTSKESYETLFSTLLEIGKASKETQEKITSIDEKAEYAAKLAQSDNVQKELNIKNFAEISKLGNEDNVFLNAKYTNIRSELVIANDALNYENSYIQTIAADLSKAMPSRLTTYSITLNPNMKVDAKLVKIEVPVIIVAEVKDEVVSENEVKTSAVAESSDVKVEDVLLNG